MDSYSISFDGKVLGRGFWIYVVDVGTAEGRHLYVGRTGDSSSANASSPFSRIGQHLDFRSNAKGNALARNLRAAGVDPSGCRFEMIAIGPVFPEEKDFASHCPVRDKVAALEHGLASALRARGYRVLGKHSAPCAADQQVLAELVAIVEARLASAGGVPHNNELQRTKPAQAMELRR